VLITNHVLSGAVVGLTSPDAVSAFRRGFVSHFVLDAVPHFGVADEHLMRVAVPDGLTGLSVSTGAYLPDLDKPGRQFFGRSPFPAWFDRAHAAIQPESSRRLPVELAAAGVLAAALGTLLRRPA